MANGICDYCKRVSDDIQHYRGLKLCSKHYMEASTTIVNKALNEWIEQSPMSDASPLEPTKKESVVAEGESKKCDECGESLYYETSIGCWRCPDCSHL